MRNVYSFKVWLLYLGKPVLFMSKSHKIKICKIEFVTYKSVNLFLYTDIYEIQLLKKLNIFPVYDNI